MRAIRATVATATALILILVNHWWAGVEVARIQKAVGMAGAPANFGVDMSDRLKFLIKLDHFAEDYGYLLLPLIWALVFVASSVFRPKAQVEPGDAAAVRPSGE